MYPVFALSSFKPVQVLKGKLTSTTHGINIRKVLVVFQLVISIILISGTLAVMSQLKFMRSQNLGFDMEQTLVVKIPKAVESTFVHRKETFKQEIAKLRGVKGVGFSTEVPGRKFWWDNGGIFKVGQDASAGKNYMIMGVDDQFIGLYNLEFIIGRNFSRGYLSDKESVIVNERAVKWLEFDSPEDALNKQIDYWGNIYTIISVRKVMGAKVSTILSSIIKEYLILVILAFIISAPVLIWGINYWLNNFSVKMELSLWLFILPAIFVFLITIISISSHTIRAARLNPVDTLKYE